MNINATLLAQAVVMIVFVAICWRYIYPPILSVMQEREKKSLVTKSQRKCLSVRVVMFELHNTRYVSGEKSDTGCRSSGDYSS